MGHASVVALQGLLALGSVAKLSGIPVASLSADTPDVEMRGMGLGDPEGALLASLLAGRRRLKNLKHHD